MSLETKTYPDTVSAYALRGGWLEALSFVALGIEDMFSTLCDGAAKALKQRYGWTDAQVAYFAVHVGADIEHSETGWNTAVRPRDHGGEEAERQAAALEVRTMWWNMHSAVYNLNESREAPLLRVPA
jgi:pyrroloquinoline quinone (PQQ) biosynthesis protein C